MVEVDEGGGRVLCIEKVSEAPVPDFGVMCGSLSGVGMMVIDEGM